MSYPYFIELSEVFRGAYSSRRLLVLIVAIIVMFLLTVNTSWKATPDSALYLELGESLASGAGYTYNNVPHTYVPPGYPLMLSAWISLFGSDFLCYRLLMALLGILTALTGLILLFRMCGPDLGIVVGGLFAINHTIVLNSTFTSSDVPFTLMCMVSFHMILWVRGRRNFYAALFLSGIAAGLPALVRINGLGVPPALAIFLWYHFSESTLWTRASRCLFFLVAAFSLPLAWEYHKSGFPVSYHEGEYFRAVAGRSLGTQLDVVLTSAWEYLFETAYALTGISMRTVAIEMTLGLLVILGLIYALRSGERLFTVFWMIQMTGLFLSSAGSRYIAPLIPALYIFLGLGALRISSLVQSISTGSNNSVRLMVPVLFSVLAATNIGANIQTIYHARTAVQSCGAESAKDLSFFEAARWIRSHDPSATILSMNPRIMRYLTGTKTIDILRSGVPEHLAWASTQHEISEILQRDRPDYFFADSKNSHLREMIVQTIRNSNFELKEIKEAGVGTRFSLWKIGYSDK